MNPISSTGGPSPRAVLRTGWASLLARFCFGLLVFELITGLAITFAGFNAAIQWSVIVHTVAGLIMILPTSVYCLKHWQDYRRYGMSQVVLLGWVALWGLLVCLVSGCVLTWQGLFGIKTTEVWRSVHFYSTLASAIGIVPHVLISFFRVLQGNASKPAKQFVLATVLCNVSGLILIGALTVS